MSDYCRFFSQVTQLTSFGALRDAAFTSFERDPRQLWGLLLCVLYFLMLRATRQPAAARATKRGAVLGRRLAGA